MLAHSFNASYSNQDLMNTIDNSNSIAVSNGVSAKLRMTRSSLNGASPIQADLSFRCTGIKQDGQASLRIIEYNMQFRNDTNWETARDNFQQFLHRKLNIDISSIIIEGIVSGTRTSYIIRNTTTLMTAINNMIPPPSPSLMSDPRITGVAGAAIILLLMIVYWRSAR